MSKQRRNAMKLKQEHYKLTSLTKGHTPSLPSNVQFPSASYLGLAIAAKNIIFSFAFLFCIVRSGFYSSGNMWYLLALLMVKNHFSLMCTMLCMSMKVGWSCTLLASSIETQNLRRAFLFSSFK